jgi:hypothetical protein
LNELKSTSLLNHQDLHTNIQRRGANLELWITSHLSKFLIWTKSDLLDNSKLEEMLQEWMNEVETLLKENVSGLFVRIEELDILCVFRGEIVSLLVDLVEEVGAFGRKVCEILVKEIATQMIRLMSTRIKRIHELERSARKLIDGFKCTLSFKCTNKSG